MTDANVHRIREKMLRGELPKADCRMTWFGAGRDGKCVACDEAIVANEVEVECDLPNGGTIRFHQRCYNVWVEEWPSYRGTQCSSLLTRLRRPSRSYRDGPPRAPESCISAGREDGTLDGVLHATSTFWEPLMPLTIVIADDAPEYRLIVQTLLRSMDLVTVVGEAADGEEALALVRRERPDLLITDLVMPHLNGIELTRHVRKESPQTMIILMSSYTEDAYRLRASDSGADAFVNKNVLTTSLVMAVQDVVRRRLGGVGARCRRPSADHRRQSCPSLSSRTATIRS